MTLGDLDEATQVRVQVTGEALQLGDLAEMRQIDRRRVAVASSGRRKWVGRVRLDP
jgi:hypothetical protein